MSSGGEWRVINRLLGLVAVVLTGLVIAAGMAAVRSQPALALPPVALPEDEPPVVNDPVFSPPTGGFQWSVASRFGATESGAGARPGIVDYHWNSDQRPNAHGGPMYTYDPAYVHPIALTASFTGCQTESEQAASETTSTSLRYSWALRDPASGDVLPAAPGEANPTAGLRTCKWTHAFAIDPVTGRGTPTRVVLTITDPAHGDAEIPGSPYQQDITVRDVFIVSLGDSYGSGEGNPDIPRGDADEGQWVDSRCHRSVAAAAAQAALRLERADPHSSVTFLSFACSGATIEAQTAKNESPLDPYAPTDGTQPNGSGVLGPYRGAAPSPDVGFDRNDVGYRADADFLPSQIDQMVNAVKIRAYDGDERARKIDRLLVSAGGNDMGFARVSTVCVLVHQCRYREVTNVAGSGTETLEERVAEDISLLRGQYTHMASAIDATGLPVDHLSITEYPDVARNDSGAACGSILYDIFPAWVQVVGVLAAALIVALLISIPLIGGFFAAMTPAAILAVIVNGVFPPFAMNNDPVFGNEVDWAATSIAPALSAAVAQAADDHKAARVPWHFISGVADRYRNAYGAGHGYCASPSNSWIRTASDATILQGPPGVINNATTGTLHPTAAGLRETGNLIFDQQMNDLVSAPPSAPPQYSVDYGNAVFGADGWLTGCAGSGCVSNSPVVHVEAQDSDGLVGAGLRVDGVTRACTGETVAGVRCSSSRSGSTFTWSLRFTTSGAHHLTFDAVSQRGERRTLDLDIKLDKDNPTLGPPSLPPTPASGWHRGPVDVTLDGSDPGNASKLQGIRYQVDGGPVQLAAAASQLTAGMPLSTAQAHVAGDGEHTLQFWAVDGAGRTSAVQTLALKIDGTPPVVACGSADGSWHDSDVSIACTSADGLSGLATVADASFSLATGVAGGDETADARTTSRNVCDAAGNCVDAGPIGGNMVDKKAPGIAVAAPAGSYVFGQSVPASYSCTDGGSGLASCTGTVAPGAAVDTGSVGQKTFTVDASDALGHQSTRSVVYDVNKAATTTSVTPDVNPSVFGQPVTLTAVVAVVAPGAGAPSGSVQFKDGGVALGAPVTLTNGSASLTTSSLAVGNHAVTSVYSGDGNLLGSTSTAVTQTVNRAVTTTVVSSDVNPSQFGQAVTFTATVSPVAPGSGVPTGTVQFRNGSGDIGSPVPVVNGVASLRVGLLVGGDRSITALYSGDSSFLDSTGSIVQRVTAAQVVSGQVKGALTLGAGTWFLDGATVTGDLRVERDAAVSIRNATITGSLRSNGAAVLAVCGTDVGGTTTVSDTAGFVLLGDPNDDDCAGNTFRGTASVNANRGGVEIGANRFRGGLSVDANTGSGPLPEDSGTEIEANQVTGKLGCSSNTPPPSNDGRPNTADARLGQCSSPTF